MSHKISAGVFPASYYEGKILSLEERDRVTDRWLKVRLNTILPKAMRDNNTDMWIITSREYNQDPIFRSLVPSFIHSPGRLTIIVFSLNRDNTVDKYIIAPDNPQLEGFYEVVWDVNNETRWECLSRIVKEKSPDAIGINTSKFYALCDGLTHAQYELILKALGDDYSQKVKSAESLCIQWLETRSKEELAAYPSIAELASSIAREALSNKVIHPGITTTNDVVSWIRQRVSYLGLETSFHPTIDIQRRGEEKDRLDNVIILPGDIVHIDFGIYYLGLATDTQQLAYVLNIDEKDVPEGIKAGIATANRLEDIIAGNFVEGRTGNEIFTKSLQHAKNEGIEAMIYSHPMGATCHGAGPTIGLYNRQEEIPVHGDNVLRNNTCYAMEFNIRQYIPEWKQDIPIYLEQPIAFVDGNVYYLAERQTEIYIIR